MDQPYYVPLENKTINSLELAITEECNNIIDFQTIPVFYAIGICKK